MDKMAKDGLIPVALLGIGAVTALGLGAPTHVKDFLNRFDFLDRFRQPDENPKTDPVVPDSTTPNLIDVPDNSKNEKDDVTAPNPKDLINPNLIEIVTPNPKPDVVDTVTRPEPKSNEQKVEEIKTEKSKVIQVSKGIKTNPKTVFTGHGSTFEGGSITEIDIGRRSTGQIAKEYGVTASQAANIRAQSRFSKYCN